jgi:hypothetical protein
MKNNIKPCPKCRSDDIAFDYSCDGWSSEIRCLECDFGKYGLIHKDKLLEWWNKYER